LLGVCWVCILLLVWFSFVDYILGVLFFLLCFCGFIFRAIFSLNILI
jgi:hypothetical protein